MLWIRSFSLLAFKLTHLSLPISKSLLLANFRSNGCSIFLPTSLRTSQRMFNAFHSPLSSLTPRFILPLPCHQNYFLPRSLVTSTLLNPMDSLHTSDLISHFLPLMMLYSFFFKLKKLFYMYLIGR